MPPPIFACPPFSSRRVTENKLFGACGTYKTLFNIIVQVCPLTLLVILTVPFPSTGTSTPSTPFTVLWSGVNKVKFSHLFAI